MPYTPPSRLDFWLSRLPYVNGVLLPYVAGEVDPVTGQGGYFLDGGEHYDPYLGFANARDLSVAHGLAVTDWSAPLAAAQYNYRDLAVRATSNVHLSGPLAGQPNEETPGVPAWHCFLSGIARHHLETGSADAADEEAALILCPDALHANEADFRENYFHCGVQRELAEFLMACLDREAMGLGAHPMTDVACELMLGLVDRWVEPAATKKFGTWCKLFMAALGIRALIAYRARYRTDPDATRAGLVAAIPAAVGAFCDYTWSDCWHPAGTPAGSEGWDRGGISYMDIAFADPVLAPITGCAITAVGADARRQFSGPASLSDRDGHYAGSALAITGPAAIADWYTVVAYEGSSRTLTLASYAPGRDLTTGDTFTLSVNGPNPDPTEGNGPAPDLNLMLFPAFAWSAWHARTIAGDDAAADVHRARAHAVFDGAQQCWSDAYQQKQANQANYWTADGLAWLEAGDMYDDAASARVLLIPSPAGGVLLIPTPGG